MESVTEKRVLIAGASIAGLSTAWWMNKLGYNVTVVEIATEPRTAGAAVDIKGDTIKVVKRMGIFNQLAAHRLSVERIEFKNARNETEGFMNFKNGAPDHANDEIEIERDKFVAVMLDILKDDVKFIFNNCIIGLNETKDDIQVTFKNGDRGIFDLVIGCDGMHSGVRKLWFGEESAYSHFLGAYFSIIIANKLLIKEKTMQMYNVPDKAIMLNAYNHKTDIIFCFFSEKEIPYDYRNVEQQRTIISEQFAAGGWRTEELLNEAKRPNGFYFDKFCQIKMPSWSKGRVALVGDAGYCASPAAGMGASLSISGAAALADALKKNGADFESAFRDYNTTLRPFIEKTQAVAEINIRENFIPRTEEAIRRRNAQTETF